MIPLFPLLEADHFLVVFLCFFGGFGIFMKLRLIPQTFCRNTVAYLWQGGGGGRFRFHLFQYRNIYLSEYHL